MLASVTDFLAGFPVSCAMDHTGNPDTVSVDAVHYAIGHAKYLPTCRVTDLRNDDP